MEWGGAVSSCERDVEKDRGRNETGPSRARTFAIVKLVLSDESTIKPEESNYIVSVGNDGKKGKL